jgi:hypothetical protein
VSRRRAVGPVPGPGAGALRHPASGGAACFAGGPLTGLLCRQLADQVSPRPPVGRGRCFDPVAQGSPACMPSALLRPQRIPSHYEDWAGPPPPTDHSLCPRRGGVPSGRLCHFITAAAGPGASPLRLRRKPPWRACVAAGRFSRRPASWLGLLPISFRSRLHSVPCLLPGARAWRLPCVRPRPASEHTHPDHHPGWACLACAMCMQAHEPRPPHRRLACHLLSSPLVVPRGRTCTLP